MTFSFMANARVRLAAGFTALALVAGACGSSDADQAASGATEVADGPVLDASVLSGDATTVAGDAFDLGTLADADLVVWFWAPW